MVAPAATRPRRWAIPRLPDSIVTLRNKLIKNRNFRRWASAFPATRPIARRRARALFDLCAGFVYSQILLACVRLDLFSILADGPQPIELLRRRLGLEADAARTLLDGAVSLRLVERRGRDRYGLGSLGAAIVDEPGLLALIEHHALLYDDLRDPVALLRGEPASTRMADYWPYASSGDPTRLPGDSVGAYTALMSASQAMIADQVVSAFPFRRFRRLLDVGGGDGSFALAVGATAPALELIVFDLPAVATQAKTRIEAAGLASRAKAVGGNFLRDPLPTEADIVSLVRILHDHPDADAASLLGAVFDALPPGGVVLVCEPMSGTPGAEPIGEAYFGLYLLAMGSGRPRSADENIALLADAGFCNLRLLKAPMPMLASIVVGEKPN